MLLLLFMLLLFELELWLEWLFLDLKTCPSTWTCSVTTNYLNIFLLSNISVKIEYEMI